MVLNQQMVPVPGHKLGIGMAVLGLLMYMPISIILFLVPAVRPLLILQMMEVFLERIMQMLQLLPL